MRTETGAGRPEALGIGTQASPGGATAGAVLAGAAVGTGLMAGLFFAFDVGVMPGLAKTGDLVFVTVMQRINAEIENGLFGLVFLGAFLATGVAAALQHRLGRHRAALRVWGALACYAGMLAITAGVNIPLNQALARAGDPAEIPDLHAVRTAFEGPWRLANAARTAACTAALGLLARALILHRRSARPARR
ncbi:anthrone oxygenase family protein [Streptomonospora litoralis]|uniref:DUF1772 domain-containing protein n=1 Tax=Streptomonospora litoralis TaxID=2498135 RepID=A0A4P6Q748_9ACTN|nr:anthrone oxygenase family protein [Streptomonospora litoralis]QBI54919.1 hypothetical protein EKD16_15735 [Streptomonospora litoralis]